MAAASVDDSEQCSSKPRREAFDDERFRKSERLRKRAQFLGTRRKGKRSEGRWIVVYSRSNEVGHPRIGITVSRRVGNAVVRNRWKRRLREIFRRGKRKFGADHDVVIIVKSRGDHPDYEDLKNDVYGAVRRAQRSGRNRRKKR